MASISRTVKESLAEGLCKLGLYGKARLVWSRAVARTRRVSDRKRRMLEFYSNYVVKGDLCFDIGANMGDRTEVFLALGARVVAIEPQEMCIQYLRARCGRHKGVAVVQKAVSNRIGDAEMAVAGFHALSSLSEEWVRRVSASGRFGDHIWRKRRRVPTTTLDGLIEEFGEPGFCKIDVEGYEFEVLKGLSQPIRTLSFEYTPEHIEAAMASIRYLADLGTLECNYSVGESMRLEFEYWIDPERMCRVLEPLSKSREFGDIYARFVR